MNGKALTLPAFRIMRGDSHPGSEEIAYVIFHVTAAPCSA